MGPFAGQASLSVMRFTRRPPLQRQLLPAVRTQSTVSAMPSGPGPPACRPALDFHILVCRENTPAIYIKRKVRTPQPRIPVCTNGSWRNQSTGLSSPRLASLDSTLFLPTSGGTPGVEGGLRLPGRCPHQRQPSRRAAFTPACSDVSCSRVVRGQKRINRTRNNLKAIAENARNICYYRRATS